MRGFSVQQIEDRDIAAANARPRVEVLLSTYNGARYLDELLDSLAAQDYPNFTVSVRDDGSTDATLEVLERYRDRLDMRIEAGERLGVPECFFELVRRVEPDSDFIAFADQDDVWLPDKISRAVDWLSDTRSAVRPVLYCARVKVTNARLRVTGESPLPEQGPSFRNALAQNIAIGCTAAMNRAGLALLRELGSNGAQVHDWWCYLAFTAFGEVRYDPQPCLYYRQHASNFVGASTGPVPRFVRRLVRQFNRERRLKRVRQLDSFLAAAGPRLAPEHRALIKDVLSSRRNLQSRFDFALRTERMMQSRSDDLAFRIVYLLGNY